MIDSKYFKYVLLAIMVIILVFNIIIFLKLININNIITHNKSNSISSSNQDDKDLSPKDRNKFNISQDYTNKKLYEMKQEILRNNFGANYYRSQHIIDPSIFISAEDYRKQKLEETQTIENRLKK